MRTLILLRHAKSDYPPGVRDVDRPLSARGVRDAGAARDWLRATYPRIDEVRVSPAARAQQTLSLVRPAWTPCTEHTDDRIYDAWGERLPDVVSDLNPDSRTALIIGHNPGIEEYAISLCRHQDLCGCERMHEKFPTAAIAVAVFSRDWADQAAAQLVVFAVPRPAE